MADTSSNVRIPSQTWVNLYSSRGLPTGMAVTVVNTGSNAVYLAVKALQPTDNQLGIILYSGPVGNAANVSSGASGLWAYCPDGISYVNVQE